ncbi:Amino Acid/Auxin Permease [Phytophthora megakarya]|uniref:Amino Acid/Auxin Permease n=1 Tax=Phytophthora megakarya TaxID=4795 RepID=A0A225WLR5_9STRA|nr:Amino Acid/Auxin Permease [Phytophthora megakarya]
MAKQPFFTFEDAKFSFSLFCCMCGVGTLSMPANFARAGPVLGSVATVFMALANIYASVAMSKVLLLAPNSVNTFSDLGEWCMGKTGRWLCVISQMGSCLLMPCVFLVLGGGLLDGLFPGAWDTTTWIILMTITVLPLALVPTLKEGAGAAFAGCMGTLIADSLGIAIVAHGMSDHTAVPSPELSVDQVVGAFGSLAMGFGAGIVLSDVQRQHSDPGRMPRVVTVTMVFIMCMLLILGFVPYYSVGCQISGNLLYVIYPDASTGLTTLGFTPKWGTVVLAYLAMQMHVTIAFSVLINPAFYIAERLVLGMHKRTAEDVENQIGYQESNTPVTELFKQSEKQSEVSRVSAPSNRRSRTSVFPLTGEIHNNHDLEAAEYRGANAIKYIVLRLAIIAVLVILSIIFKDNFSDFVDFVGASAITANCIVLPTIFYLIKTWEQVPMYEKFGAVVVIVVCTVLGGYSTYTAGKHLFFPSDSETLFPYCDAEFQDTVYYNQTA